MMKDGQGLSKSWHWRDQSHSERQYSPFVALNMLIVSWITVLDNLVNNSVESESTNHTTGASSPDDFLETTIT
ncbi:hypothetical protein KC354_g128 [Hortaea werneckii]|nr:hypothetical protein KC354_g128 [Hortaea werneckii]